jgi:hypothetical protein
MSKKTIIILLLVSIAFAPSLRSCGDISYGFPTVAIEAKDPITITKFHPLNTLINFFVIGIIFILLKNILADIEGHRIFKYGLKGVYLYQLILFFSYFVLYWCIQISDKFLLMLYVLYPFSTTLLDLHKPLLETVSDNSRFFGDDFDIVIRLNYLSSLLLWFFAAIIIIRLKNFYILRNKNKINQNSDGQIS